MEKISKHPIIRIEPTEATSFTFRGREIKGQKGFTLASALHQAGFPVHSHSIIGGRNRGMSCGIGKCGACEMLVDGEVRRICITLCDGVKEVAELPTAYLPGVVAHPRVKPRTVYTTTVAIIGGGPAGLAARAKLREFGIDNLVIDNQDRPGGQFSLQTHRFFFFEDKKRYGNKRGFEIAGGLAGDDQEGILLNCTVWDILEDKTIAVKNIRNGEIFYIACEKLVVAAGAIPLLPVFVNDDLPGVYTAAVVQKMMNRELTLLGKNVLTVGAGNIGYLTSYQLRQAGARVKAIIEAMPAEGGFPVQANRVRRLGIPILTGKILLEAVPSADGKRVSGAVIADADNFQAIPGTEKLLTGIDLINICTGLAPDNKLLRKGREIFGVDCYGAGDALRISEGTSAVLRGTQAAYEIVDSLGKQRYDYDAYLAVSKAYLDSQQRPVEVLAAPDLPPESRRAAPFTIIDCLYGFACNPCTFSCPQGAISKISPRTVPKIDYEKCIGCMTCVGSCPGMAIFGFDLAEKKVVLALEFDKSKGEKGLVVDNKGRRLAEATIDEIRVDKRGTRLLKIDVSSLSEEELLKVRGFISRTDLGGEPDWTAATSRSSAPTYICHCDDVQLEEILKVIGGRTTVSLNEIKHTTRLAMGACRGKKCIPRLRQILRSLGIRVTGESTPRAPLANLVEFGELYPAGKHDRIILPHVKTIEKNKVGAFVAGGGIGGSALFRYLAQEGLAPVMINHGLGSSWRNIGAGRPVFGVPELSEIARCNREIFRELQNKGNIDLTEIYYVTMAHDEKLLESLEASLAWQEGEIIEARRFLREISPYFNPKNKDYLAALKTANCWHAVPGKTIDLIRHIGLEAGGTIHEGCELIDVTRKGGDYLATVRDRDGKFCRYESEIFINALGPAGNTYAEMLGIDTGLYAVKHEAFITRSLHNLGQNNTPLPMLIDRRAHHGFTAVYGYQLAETGQIIGCASPGNEHERTGRNLKVNSRDFLEIVAETFVDWIPVLSSVGFQAVWSGYYVEPRMIIDPELGLFLGLRGQGFMLGQYLAQLYVDTLLGRQVPDYYERLKLHGDGLVEKAMK